MEKLLDILSNCCPTVDFAGETALITDKIIDSMDLIAIISDIEEEYEISIDMDKITPDNFNSAEAMMSLIESLK